VAGFRFAGIKGNEPLEVGKRSAYVRPCRSISPSSCWYPETWRSMPYFPELEGLRGFRYQTFILGLTGKTDPRSTTFVQFVPICSACTPTMSNTCREYADPGPFHGWELCLPLPSLDRRSDCGLIARHHEANSSGCSPTTSAATTQPTTRKFHRASRRPPSVYKVGPWLHSSFRPSQQSRSPKIFLFR